MSFAYSAVGWAIVGAGAWYASSSNTNAKTEASAKQQQDRIMQKALNPNLGNLSKEEAKTSASKKMMREGLFYTSPTGLGTGGSRGRSRLMGS